MCEVSLLASNDVLDPYDAVGPYSTCESAGSSVSHDTTAPDADTDDTATDESTGAVTSAPDDAEVVKVRRCRQRGCRLHHVDLTR